MWSKFLAGSFTNVYSPTNSPTSRPRKSPTAVPSTKPRSSAPSMKPSQRPSVKPASLKPTPSPSTATVRICQFSGYCQTARDCVPGNKCNQQSQYYSQCIADPTTYAAIASGCVSNNGATCTAASKCCDPGSYCDLTLPSPQCHQPVKDSGLCISPTGF